MKKSLVLAGGCFWCVEHDLRGVPGILSVISGYSGGEMDAPTYENHKSHREAVLVEYDDNETSYKKLLQFFIDHIDPTDNGGQFADRGESYMPAIFYENEEERRIAVGVIQELDDSHIYDTLAVIDVLPRKPFHAAEEYHQQYAVKHPFEYNLYRAGSGRGAFVNRTCQIREEKNVPWSD